MPDVLAHVLQPATWPTFVLITARLGGLMMLAPLWSMSTLPGPARAAITLVLSALLLPAAPVSPLPEQVLDLPLPMVGEMAIGLVIGLAAAVLVQAVALAGEVVSLQMGLSIAPQLAPVPDVQVSGVGQLAAFLALALYAAIGGHLSLFRGLADSLQSLPPGTLLSLAGGGRVAVDAVQALFACAVCAAAPVMVAMLLVNLALAILSRAVPQLNAMMVSFPITIGIGLLMMAASLPLVSGAVGGWFEQLPSTVERLVRAFRPAGV